MVNDPLQDTLKTKWHFVGKILAVFGLDSWRDNYDNELSGNKLYCAERKETRELNTQEAALLHLSTQLAGEPTPYNIFNINDLVEGEKKLGRFESPLHTACKAGKKEQEQQR